MKTLDPGRLALELKLKSDALENSLNGFDIVDANGNFIYANQAYLKMWGHESLDEIFGKPAANHCADPNLPKKIIAELRQHGECHLEFMAKRKDGSLFPVVMWARLAFDPDGNEVYPTTSIDITERKEHEEALKKAKEEAEKANRLKSAFLANMSHEIRTPLGAILGFAEVLRHSKVSEEKKNDYLDILTRNGEQLLSIINDILDLSKVEAGYLVINNSEIKIKDLLDEVIQLFQIKAQEQGLQIFHKNNLPHSFFSDRTRVKQVLVNLIGNAVKFTSNGTVEINCFEEQDKSLNRIIHFDITDTGIGISEVDRERIFEMFVQGDESLSRQFGGTGLGLALSQKLAQCMGGQVSILRTQLGKGTTVRFTVKDQLTISKYPSTISLDA